MFLRPDAEENCLHSNDSMRPARSLGWRHNSSVLLYAAAAGDSNRHANQPEIRAPAGWAIAAPTSGESGVIAGGTKRTGGPAWAEIRGGVVSMSATAERARSSNVNAAHALSTWWGGTVRPSNYPGVTCLNAPDGHLPSRSTTHMLFIISDKQPGAFCCLNERPNDEAR